MINDLSSFFLNLLMAEVFCLLLGSTSGKQFILSMLHLRPGMRGNNEGIKKIFSKNGFDLMWRPIHLPV